MHLRSLYAYSDRSRAPLEATLRDHPDLFERRFETTSKHDTIRQLFAHVVAAEQRWISSRIGGKPLEMYEERAPATVEGLFEDARSVRAETYRFMDGLDKAGFQRIIDVRIGMGVAAQAWEGRLTVEQILFHIINHETHHRAQISMALQQFGADPPNFDYIFFAGAPG